MINYEIEKIARPVKYWRVFKKCLAILILAAFLLLLVYGLFSMGKTDWLSILAALIIGVVLVWAFKTVAS